MKHKYKSIDGAVRRIVQLKRTVAVYEKLCSQYNHERKLMARLASERPEFSNPLVVWDAKKIRDEILEDWPQN